MAKIFLFIIILSSFYAHSNDNKIIIASTTSTYDTGLLKYLNKAFNKKFNTKINVIAVGTGQALKIAEDGNAEILIVHHTESELDFMKKKLGITRHEFMYNDYIVVGPKQDSNLCLNFKNKLNEIYKDQLTFISRGDDSGTHKKELEMWSTINLNPKNFDKWYLDVGQGMGNTLLVANQKLAYTLTDRGTWISFNNRENLKIICEKFPPLINQYGIILVNPKNNPKLNIADSRVYVNWIISEEGKKLINNYKVKGEQLFFFNYK